MIIFIHFKFWYFYISQTIQASETINYNATNNKKVLQIFQSLCTRFMGGSLEMQLMWLLNHSDGV